MRVLVVHNFYQHKGGEDAVFAAETAMLQANGHEVFEFTAHNDSLQGKNLVEIALNTLWSSTAKRDLAELIAKVQPEIVHFHNTFMSISPSAYYACKEANLPVVQTLHNYRLVCPKATLFRGEDLCTACVGNTLFIPAIRHACYRDSSLQTLGVAAMLNLHRLLKTWDTQIDKYICLSENSRQIFVDGGLPADKMMVKGNFLEKDPGIGLSDERYFVFLGRLSPEKGLSILLNAWKDLRDIPLKIIGEGPMREELSSFIQEHQMKHVELLGFMPHAEALELVKRATAQVVPSQWQEPFGLVAIEAFACAKAVVASKLGALSNIVEDGVNGLHFDAKDSASLAEKVKLLWEDPKTTERMGKNARQSYEQNYTSAANYQVLMKAYQELVTVHQP